MLVGYGLLHWVNSFPSKMLDRQDLLTVYHAEENDAGISRQIAQVLIVDFANEYRASTAIAFSAAFFGAG